MDTFDIHSARHFTYSQCGEDVMVRRILGKIHVTKPTYLDIGANHPIKSNNTFRFYEDGCRGVLVEPDPSLAQVLSSLRPEDTILNIGMGTGAAASANFYIMSNNVLNTFSQAEAEKIAAVGDVVIAQVVSVPLVGINDVIKQHFDGAPDFVSLDVEGIDFDILTSLNFQVYRPKVFCIETITFTQDNTEQKRHEILDFMAEQRYMVYGDTYINSIFVDRELWRTR